MPATALKRDTAKDESDTPSARQREVLAAALGLLIREGGRVSMAAVAAEANCSKETLYKWFGDRAGLMSAIVRFQAAQVRVEALEGGKLNREALVQRLRQFASDWLRVVASDSSLALNRLAIGHAGEEG